MKLSLLLVLCLSPAACLGARGGPDTAAPGLETDSPPELVLFSDVEWGPLNPARGDKGPKAGTLWGDRTGPGPSGFLVEFVDGFESPPHIHNVSYRGAVLSGLVHNDDPQAAERWMPAGSFWTQPRGAVHITSARGGRNLVYVEIEEGPYLVLPVEEAFEAGEVAVNVEPSGIAWVDAPGWPSSADGPELAPLWGDAREGELNGAFVRLPAGFTGAVRGQGSTFRAVVIQGRPRYGPPVAADDGTAARALAPGSSFSSGGGSEHRISCEPDEACVLYVRTEGHVEVLPAQPRD